MAILPKELYRFNAIPIRIIMIFFKEMEQTLLKFIWNNKPLRIAKAILGKKKMGGITLPNLKLYYNVVIIKIPWYWNKAEPQTNGTGLNILTHTLKYMII